LAHPANAPSAIAKANADLDEARGLTLVSSAVWERDTVLTIVNIVLPSKHVNAALLSAG
jgi:hypothetical protein